MNYKGGFVPNQIMDVSSQEYKNMMWCLKMRFFKLTLWSLPPGEDKPVDGMGGTLLLAKPGGSNGRVSDPQHA